MLVICPYKRGMTPSARIADQFLPGIERPVSTFFQAGTHAFRLNPVVWRRTKDGGQWAMKSELGIARSAVFGLGFRLERDEATTEDPDQEGSEQRWLEGEGHGFAEGDLLEVWMRGIEQVVRLCVNDHAWQLQHDGACFLHPPERCRDRHRAWPDAADCGAG
jgi:hypothetical protein